MGRVISLDERRRRRATSLERLEQAVRRIELAVEGWSERDAPGWLIEEVREVRARLDAGEHAGAAERAERLAERLGRRAG
jgi:hypothetical protein